MSGVKSGLEPEFCRISSFGELFHKSLLVVSPPLSIPGRLRAIFEGEFDVVSIIQASQVDAILSMDRPPARTIFLSVDYLSLFDSIRMRFGKTDVDFSIAIIYNEELHSDKLLIGVLSKTDTITIIPVNYREDILLSILKIVKAGGEYIPPHILKKFFLGKRGRVGRHRSDDEAVDQLGVAGAAASRELKGLTGREMQILEMVAHGCRNRAIAEELNLSEHTVRVHLRNIIKKLGAYNRTGAAAKYFAGGVDLQN